MQIAVTQKNTDQDDLRASSSADKDSKCFDTWEYGKLVPLVRMMKNGIQ